MEESGMALPPAPCGPGAPGAVRGREPVPPPRRVLPWAGPGTVREPRMWGAGDFLAESGGWEAFQKLWISFISFVHYQGYKLEAGVEVQVLTQAHS